MYCATHTHTADSPPSPRCSPPPPPPLSQDHVSRGLANFSGIATCSHDVLRLLKHIVMPLRAATVASFWAQCSSLCTICNLLALRREDTLKHLRQLPEFGSVLVSLTEHPNTAPIVKTLALRLARRLCDVDAASMRNSPGAATVVDRRALPRLEAVASALSLPHVAPSAETGLFEPEPAVPTLFRFGDKRTYLEQVCCVRSCYVVCVWGGGGVGGVTRRTPQSRNLSPHHL
jgi:hypothetical protein